MWSNQVFHWHRASSTAYENGSVFTLDADCSRLCVTEKVWDGFDQSYHCWICSFLQFHCCFLWRVLGEVVSTQVAEVSTVLRIFSRPLWPLCHGQRPRTHRFENRSQLSQRWNLTGVEKMKGRRKAVWLQEVCLFWCEGNLDRSYICQK